MNRAGQFRRISADLTAGLATALFWPEFTAAASTGAHGDNAELPTSKAAISKESGRNPQCNRPRISGRAGREACTTGRPHAAPGNAKTEQIPFNMRPPAAARRKVKIEQWNRRATGVCNSRVAAGGTEGKLLAASPLAGDNPQLACTPTMPSGYWYNLIGALERWSVGALICAVARQRLTEVPNCFEPQHSSSPSA